MAEIRETGLRIGAKTTKLVAPVVPGEVEKAAGAGQVGLPVRDALRKLTDAKAKLGSAAAAPELEFANPRATGVASSGALIPSSKTGPLVARADLFAPMPGSEFARPGFKSIPASALKSPLGIRAVIPFLLRGDLMTFVAGFKEAYDKLTPEQRAKYDAIANSLGNDPAAKRALAVMLVNGALDSKDLRGEGTLLDHLHRIATGPVAEGVDRRKLLADIVKDIADPSQVTQGNYDTCAAATAQRLLAGQSPAEYARIMAGLASPSGEVKLANGDTLKRPADWNLSPGDGRDLAGRMFQSATMSYAAGKNGETYSNVTDERTKANGQKKSGLNAVEVVYLFEGILGRDYEKYAKKDIGADALMQKISAVVAKGGVVPCAITVDGRNHEVLVTKIENGQVHYYDPRTGQTKTMSESEFKAKLFNANIPNQTVLAFRIGALAAFGKIGLRTDTMDIPFLGKSGGAAPKSSGAPGGESPDGAWVAGGSTRKSGLFGFSGFDDFVRILKLIGAADEEIGDGSGSGTQTSGSTGGSSSSTTTSSTSGRGRGRTTGKTAGG